MALPKAFDDDKQFLIRRSMNKGYQFFSLLAPPCYVAWVLAGKRGRSGLHLNHLLRTTWIGGAIGIAEGGLFEYLRSANSSPNHLRLRRLENTYDSASMRANDHSTIGAILFSVLTPAIFWNRGRLIDLILGGAGVGSSVGILVHLGRSITGDPPSPTAVPQLHVAR